MNLLADILSSKVRAEVFRILFGGLERELHHREIARRSGLSESAVRQELHKLTALDLINRRESGNRVYYSANSDHPLYREIYRLVLKTVGMADIFRKALFDQPVDVAFIFGSVAEGAESSSSDIDIMVIGDIGLRKLVNVFSGLTEQTGREINPHVMTRKEYVKRIQAGDHFVTHVIAGPRIYIVGTKDDFETMGKEQLA